MKKNIIKIILGIIATGTVATTGVLVTNKIVKDSKDNKEEQMTEVSTNVVENVTEENIVNEINENIVEENNIENTLENDNETKNKQSESTVTTVTENNQSNEFIPDNSNNSANEEQYQKNWQEQMEYANEVYDAYLQRKEEQKNNSNMAENNN